MAYGYKFNASQVESTFIAGGAGGVARYAEQTLFSAYTNTISNLPATSDINAVVSGPVDSNGVREVLVICQNGSAYSTTNSGVTWQTEITGTTEALYSAVYLPEYILSGDIFYSGPYWVVVGANGTIRKKLAKSNNAWTNSNTGAPAVAINKIYYMDSTLVAGASGTGTSIIKSTDKGATWVSAGTLSVNDGEMVTNIVSNQSGLGNPTRVYLAATDTGVYSNTALSGTWTRRVVGTAPFSVHYSRTTAQFHAFSWAPTTWASTRSGWSTDGVTWTTGLHYFPSRTIAGEPRQALLDENEWPYWLTDKGYVLFAPNESASTYLHRQISTPSGVNAANTGNGRHCGISITNLGSRTRTVVMDSDSLVPGLWVTRKFAAPINTLYADSTNLTHNGSAIVTTGQANGYLVRSPDGGMSWNIGYSGNFSSEYLIDAVWVSSLSKFCGSAYLSTGSTGHRKCTSTDGITWTVAGTTNTTADDQIKNLATNGTLIVGAGGGKIKTSTDGITYTTQAGTVPSLIQPGALQYLNNKFFISKTFNFGGGILYSTDGTTWTSATINVDVSTFTIHRIAWDGTKYLCFAENGIGNAGSSYGSTSTSIYVLTSTDGINWTGYSPGSGFIGTESIYSVAWSATLSLFVAVSHLGVIFTSPTGLVNTWTKRTIGSTATGRYFRHVHWTGSQFLAFGNYGQAFRSTDGVTWKNISTLSLGFTDVYLPVSAMIRPYGTNNLLMNFTPGAAKVKLEVVQDQVAGTGYVLVDSSSSYDNLDILILAV